MGELRQPLNPRTRGKEDERFGGRYQRFQLNGTALAFYDMDLGMPSYMKAVKSSVLKSDLYAHSGENVRFNHTCLSEDKKSCGKRM